MRQVLGDEALVPGISPDLTAEDFGFYLQKVPGAFLWLGCGIKDQPVHGLHNAKFCPDEQALVVGSRLMSQLAINALQQLKAGKISAPAPKIRRMTMKMAFIGDSLVSCPNVTLTETWPDIAGKSWAWKW